jgi:hypothetical protein
MSPQKPVIKQSKRHSERNEVERRISIALQKPEPSASPQDDNKNIY